MKIIKINNKYVTEGVPYETHKRGKNYAAIITGLDEKFGLAREWLTKVNVESGKEYMFGEEQKPKKGMIIEIRATYYSGGGYPSPSESDGFYEVQKNGELVKIEKNDVLSRFSKKEEVYL